MNLDRIFIMLKALLILVSSSMAQGGTRFYPESSSVLSNRNLPHVVRVAPDEAGVVATVPTTWWDVRTINGVEIVTGGASVYSVRHAGLTSPVLYLEGLTTAAQVVSFNDDDMSFILAGESRSNSVRTTSIGLKTASGIGTIVQSVTGLGAKPVEIKFWR